MQPKKFELWLDESGNFESDYNTSWNPSLVGGVLVEKYAFDKTKVSEILGRKEVHSVDEKDPEYQVEVLQRIVENGGDLIIFENAERLKIVDSTITYLNIMSEGIIQLIQLLTAEHGAVELDILKAVRKDMVKTEFSLIDETEYRKRLEEKIVLGQARRLLYNHSQWKWDIEMGSARKDERLMLADVVCNTRLTRTSNKFSEEQEKEIGQLYFNKYIFTVFEKSTVSNMKRLIAEGALADAIFEVYTTEEDVSNTEKDELINSILERLQTIGSEGKRLQLLNLKNKIGTLVKINKDFIKSELILIKLQEDFIIRMKEKELEPGMFALDIYLYLLTVYTHQGNIKKAKYQIILCEEAMDTLANRWESIDYFFMFRIRLAVHKINCFDFQASFNEMTDIVNSLKETMELFSIIDGLSEIYDNLRADVLGKALGTRLQASTMLLRKEDHLYESAVEDSDRALKEFSRSGDIKRQHQYRSQIEYEAGNYELAVEHLMKVSNLKYNGSESIRQFLSAMSQEKAVTQSYCLMHYTKIIAEAAAAKEFELADLLYSFLLKERGVYNNIMREDTIDHPYEIIVWKVATYQGLKGNTSAAMKLYDQAIGICFSRPERWTFLAIGLGILAEKSSMLLHSSKRSLKEADRTFRIFNNKYTEFMELDLPESMREYFMPWKEEIDKIKNSEDIQIRQEILWKLSREITY